MQFHYNSKPLIEIQFMSMLSHSIHYGQFRIEYNVKIQWIA